MNCPKCNYPINENEYQCSHCGTVTVQLTCSQCSAPLDLRYPRCTTCGATYTLPYGNPYLQKQPSASTPRRRSSYQAAQREAKQNGQKKKLLLIGGSIAVALVAAGILLWVFLGRSQPDNGNGGTTPVAPISQEGAGQTQVSQEVPSYSSDEAPAKQRTATAIKGAVIRDIYYDRGLFTYSLKCEYCGNVSPTTTTATLGGPGQQLKTGYSCTNNKCSHYGKNQEVIIEFSER